MSESTTFRSLLQRSRREFIQAASALGLAPLAARSLSAFGQAGTRSAAGGRTGADDVEVMEGTAGALIVQQLRAAGMKYVFHTNTSGVEEITGGLLETPDMHIIMITHEGQAVAAVEGYAMATGELAFFVGSSDGVENAASNLHNAWVDGTPMIVSFAGNSLESLEGFTTWSAICDSAESMPATVRRAMECAVGPPGGPVALAFPSNLQDRRIKAAIQKMPSPTKHRAVFRAPQDVVEKLARWLIEAQNPLFMVGYEVTRGGANRAMQKLAEKLAVPVTQAARWEDLFCDFATDHPLFLGNYISPMRFPQNVDLFVNFGAKFVGRIPPPAEARIAHVSFDSSILGATIRPHLPVLADVASTISDLSDAIDSLATADRLEKIRAARLEQVRAFSTTMRQSQQMAVKARFDQAPLSWERIGYELERALAKNAVVVPELGTQKDKLLSQMTFGPDNKLRLGRTTGGALGWGMGAAFGVQLGLPDRQVVSIIGDGALLFGQTETLWSIARYEAPILIVVMNNHSYNETRNRNLGRSGIDRDLTSYLGSPDVDFTKIAAAYGVAGEKVTTPDALAPALQRAVRQIDEGRPVLLDVEVGRDGILRESTWYSTYSIAEVGGRKRRS
jgi:benzoylformate decarboxylase